MDVDALAKTKGGKKGEKGYGKSGKGGSINSFDHGSWAGSQWYDYSWGNDGGQFGTPWSSGSLSYAGTGEASYDYWNYHNGETPKSDPSAPGLRHHC